MWRGAYVGPMRLRGRCLRAGEGCEKAGEGCAGRLLSQVVMRRSASARRGVNSILMRGRRSHPHRVRRGLQRWGAFPPLGVAYSVRWSDEAPLRPRRLRRAVAGSGRCRTYGRVMSGRALVLGRC